MDIQNANQLPVMFGGIFGNATVNLFAAIDANNAWIDWVLGAVVIAVGLASLGFWSVAFMRLGRNEELIPYQRSECVLGFIDVVATFACWLGAQVAVGVVLVAIAGPEAMKGGEEELFSKHGVLLLYLSAGFGIASLLVGSGYLLVRYRTTNSFGLRFRGVAKQIGYGVVVFTMFFPVTLLIQMLLSLLVEYDHPVLSVLAENPSFVSIFGCWAAAVLAAPFVEEFLFRGVFQHWLERLSVSNLTDDLMLVGGSSSAARAARAESISEAASDKQGLPTADISEAEQRNPYSSPFGQATARNHENQMNQSSQRKFAYWPILVSSACFALVHLGQGLAPIPLFILALGLGYLFRQTGSLIACITVHFLLNFYSMLVFTVMILLGETP